MFMGFYMSAVWPVSELAPLRESNKKLAAINHNVSCVQFINRRSTGSQAGYHRALETLKTAGLNIGIPTDSLMVGKKENS